MSPNYVQKQGSAVGGLLDVSRMDAAALHPWQSSVQESIGTAATLGRIGNRLVISEPKTDRSRRSVPLSPAVVAMLRKHRAAQAAGVEHIGVHTLRHSAAVSWLESGVHIKAVADLLGDSSIAITGDVCGHTSDDTARAAVDGLAGRLGL